MYYLIFLAYIFNIVVSLYSEDVPHFSGFYTDGLDKTRDKVEIVYPEKVSKDGSFVSFYLPHYYDLESMEGRHRRTPGQPRESSGGAIHFFVPIGGENHQLELWPNLDFISPALVVERRDARDVENVNKAKFSQISKRQCHYNGQIVGKPNSSVALSTCHGLAGYIRVPEAGEYFIEPVKDSSPAYDREHPHIMYKRSDAKGKHNEPNCLTKGTAKEALADRMQWEALFGEEMRKRLSGINMNELVQDDIRKITSHNSNDKPLEDKIEDQHNVPSLTGEEETIKILPKVNMKNEKRNELLKIPPFNNQGMPQLDRPVNLDSNQHYNIADTISILPAINKMKQKLIKDETVTGNNKLQDVNVLSPKPVVFNVDDTNKKEISDSMIDYEMNEDEPENKRSKRSTDNEKYDDSKPNSDENNVFENHDGNLKSHRMTGTDNKYDAQSNAKNEINGLGNITRRNTGSQSFTDIDANEKGGKIQMKNLAKRGIANNEKLQSFTNEDYINNKKQVNVENKEKLDSKNVDQERENNLKSADSYVENHVDYNTLLSELNKIDVPQDYSVGISDLNKHMTDKISDSIPVNEADPGDTQAFDDNSKKRDIHLDTSEKSWKSNTNSESTNNDVGKKYKNSNHEKIHTISEHVSGSDIDTVDPFQFETENTKDFKSSKHSKTNKVEDDGKIMTSVLESVMRDVDSAKVKKSINEENNSLYSKQKDSPKKLKDLITQNNGKLISFETVPEAVESNEQVLHLDKYSKDGSSFHNEQLLMGDSSINKPNSDHHDEIIIRIRTPENTGNNEKNVDSEKENVKHEKGEEENIALGPYNDPNLKLIKAPKIVTKDKNKRGASNKLYSEFDIEKLKQTMMKQPINDKQDNENIIFDSVAKNQKLHDNTINSNDIHQGDDNPIHLVIETEPKTKMLASNLKSEKSGLFCQGQNCLEIKPVILNNTQAVASLTNVTNPEIVKPTNLKTENNKILNIKTVEKREVFDSACVTSSTTELPLVCFDFFNRPFNIEIMVTVDYKVVKMHEDDDIENFILTIINMVSSNFYDKSVGINLSVVLVRLILLTTCIKELDSDRFNPEELLENFCTWQVLVNPGRDDHPHHHDLAIFVTRMEKCQGKVMGVAYMTSVCRSDKACLVCVDEGLLLANTITHQIGHSLGADHDDSQSSGCSGTSPWGNMYHMAPTISEQSSTWSSCSRDSIIQFIRTQGSWCLTDTPVDRSYNFPLMLPGQIYSAAQQCKLNFHMPAIPCVVGPFCEKLYCQVTEKLCATKGDPPADGTFCASDMWCFHKQCVHIGRRPGSINGEWGPWTEWTTCTRSCGGGISSSYRICNNPKPENGGRYCLGQRIRHRMCGTNPCQGNSESFRDLQCKKTEERPFKGRLHNWIQYHSHFLNIECALVCQNRKGDVVMRSPVVADGTPCKAGTRNVCIQGVCRSVGCDFVIDSKAKEDACGVCHGNATECRIIQGVFDEVTATKGLVEFLRVPKRAGMVFVREEAPSINTLVVSGSLNHVFYLNGLGNEETMPGDISFGMTHGVYERKLGMERIFIRGPTAEELVFYVYSREPNRGVEYQYSIPETDPTYIPRYLWQFLDWDPCTDPCSGGSQRAHPKCVEDRGGVVDDQYCSESTKPMDIIRRCNLFPCSAKWWVSVWSDCICTGTSSIMFRSVLCMRALDESGTRAEIVRESECSDFEKPTAQKLCNATDDESECAKRSIPDDALFRELRSVSPKIAYSAASPPEPEEKGSGGGDLNLQELDIANIRERDKQVSEEKNIKSVTKLQDNKINKSPFTKQKPKLEKEQLRVDKKKIVSLKSKDTDKTKPLITPNAEGKKSAKVGVKKDEPLLLDHGKQIVKLKSGASDLKHPDKSNQAGDSDDSSNADIPNPDDKCVSTTSGSGSCPTQEPETTEASTCKETNAIPPHKKTTCCRTFPHRKTVSQTTECTTIRPVVVKLEDLNMNNFALTIVPLDISLKKKLPQSDPEFMNLGNVGQFDVGDEANGTILVGQEALDFLDFARNNASEEPVILHEEMHG